MTSIEIKQRIDENNKTIQAAFQPNNFMLNNMVRDLLNENKALQDQCKHEFDEDDFCIFCYKMKGE